MRIIFIFAIVVSFYTCAQTSVLGKWYTELFPTFVYEFDSNDSVVFTWVNDIGSYQREGVYQISGDTVLIEYEPIFDITNFIDSSENDLILIDREQSFFRKISYKIFTNDSTFILYPDSTGKTIFTNVANIDSIYFSSRSSFTNPFYQIDQKDLVPGTFEVRSNYHLLQYVFESNSETLIILNEKEIYRGEDYDPEMFYIGGILRR